MTRRGEGGFTVVEVLVAMTILLVGIGATVTALTGSRRLTQKSERTDQGVAIAQREVERMRSMKFENIATKTLPDATTGQPAGLNLLVAISGVIRLQVNVPQHAETLVPADSTNGVAQQSCIAPASDPDTSACPLAGRISSGQTRGTVYRYVSTATSCIQALITSLCVDLNTNGDTTQQGKRITVVVKLDAITGVTASTIQTDTVVAPT